MESNEGEVEGRADRRSMARSWPPITKLHTALDTEQNLGSPFLVHESFVISVLIFMVAQ